MIYIQTVDLFIPPDVQDRFEQVVYTYFVPAVRRCPGFLSASIIADHDDPSTARLLIYWRDSSASLCAGANGILVGAYLRMAAVLPGLEIKTAAVEAALPHKFSG
ncbi:MAG: antibiotic biosynthesis monooxygenase [Chloroflexota bacterium]